MRILTLIWLIVSSITVCKCHLDHNSETGAFQLLRKFFNDGTDYNAESDKRSYPWNPMQAYSYRDWLKRLLKSPVYQK